MKNERIKSCPYQKNCGACVSIGKEYAVTLKEKEEAVRKLLKPFVSLEGITGMENPYHYRNKNHRVCAYERLGRRERAVSGIYAEGTHKVIPVGSCLIEDEAAGAIFDTVLELAKSFKYRFYDEDMGRGLLRHILIRTAHKTGQIMVVLVLADPVLPGKNNFVKALTARHPEITTIVLNVNRKPTSMILGEKETVAYGKGYIEDELCGRRFRISAHSFYQVNSVQTEKLYGKAIELMDLKADDVLLDAYCGIGTIGIIASGSAGKVIGVEANSGAVRDAVDNAKRNGVKNISFAAEDAGAFLSRTLLKKTPLHAVVMDPPRSGATEEFLQALTTAAPSRIVYISCNPETLARDLRYLTGHGYAAVTARAFDLFPWTSHVETVCLLSKLSEAKNHISVKVNMDEMDVTAAESKATYDEIREWVQDNYGFRVTNLNIAQVKRKHGIIERENYNKPKSLDSKQPGCTEEKVKAIEAALHYFKMIYEVQECYSARGNIH